MRQERVHFEPELWFLFSYFCLRLLTKLSPMSRLCNTYMGGFLKTALPHQLLQSQDFCISSHDRKARKCTRLTPIYNLFICHNIFVFLTKKAWHAECLLVFRMGNSLSCVPKKTNKKNKIKQLFVECLYEWEYKYIFNFSSTLACLASLCTSLSVHYWSNFAEIW